MDPTVIEITKLMWLVLPLIAVVVGITMAGVIFNNWLRVKHGYPLDGAWGQAIYPKSDRELAERITLLTNENAQLRAELGSIKDRLQNVERIVTDKPSALSNEIEALRLDKGGNA